MNKDKFFYYQVCIDCVPFSLLEEVNVKQLMQWSEFLHKINFENMKDVYSYLNQKFTEIIDNSKQ